MDTKIVSDFLYTREVAVRSIEFVFINFHKNI
jgi:hypothetical protein